MQQPPPAQPRRADEPLPEAREVVPGIWKITLPIPFPLRTVNTYAIVGKDGWALVDAGMGIPAAREAFTAGLARAGLSVSNLQAIVLTHHHPDHIGLSGELQKQSGARVYMHPIDEKSLRIIWDGTMPERFGHVSRFFQQHGLEHTSLWYTQTNPQVMKDILSVPPHEAFEAVEDGRSIELIGDTYRVFWVPGHSDGQIVLLRERDGLFFSADHVLPRITPNVGLYSRHDRPNPLGDYLDSLHKVEDLPVSLALPGHSEPFPNLGERAREIARHHSEREAKLLDLLGKQALNATQLTLQLFANRRLESDEAKRMAIAEVLAHLEHMRLTGSVEQQLSEQDIILYKAV